jgi:chemotaxis protein methyltransferase CheR
MTFSFSDKKYILNESVFFILRDLIHTKTGLYYDDKKKQLLRDKIIPLLIAKEIDSFLDYYYLLKYDDQTSPDEWQDLINTLSVPETFFWREYDQIDALVNIIIPDYLQNCTEKKEGYTFPNFSNPLKIWSAACSTGEEAITITMSLKEAGLLDKIPIKIYASDASTRSLKLAREGLYREHSFRNLSPSLRQKYFTQKNNLWQFSPDLRHYVNWQRANLLNKSELVNLADARFVFCRNVFIYFSPQYIQKTVEMFYDAMPSPSYLFIGASESLLKFKTRFEFQKIGNAFVYVKN